MKDSAGKFSLAWGLYGDASLQRRNYLGVICQKNISGKRGHTFMKNRVVGWAFLLWRQRGREVRQDADRWRRTWTFKPRNICSWPGNGDRFCRWSPDQSFRDIAWAVEQVPVTTEEAVTLKFVGYCTPSEDNLDGIVPCDSNFHRSRSTKTLWPADDAVHFKRIEDDGMNWRRFVFRKNRYLI